MILKALSPTVCTIALDRRSKRRFPLRMVMWFRPAGVRFPADWTEGESLNLSSTGMLFSGLVRTLPGQKIEALIDWPPRPNNRGDLRLALEGVIVRSTAHNTAMRVEHYEFRLSNSPQQA
jgi:hypothetical protein